MRAAAPLRLIAVAVLVGCAPPPPAAPDAGGAVCSPNLPPSSAPCLEGQCGNEIGVGQQCTAQGGECSDWDLFEGEAGLCTATVDDTDVWFCTRPCESADDCGTGAVCQGDPEDPGGPQGCVPAACADVPPVD